MQVSELNTPLQIYKLFIGYKAPTLLSTIHVKLCIESAPYRSSNKHFSACFFLPFHRYNYNYHYCCCCCYSVRLSLNSSRIIVDCDDDSLKTLSKSGTIQELLNNECQAKMKRDREGVRKGKKEGETERKWLEVRVTGGDFR